MAKENISEIGFEKQIWDAADELRGSMDAAEYKHVVLGLIFLKYLYLLWNSNHQASLLLIFRYSPTYAPSPLYFLKSFLKPQKESLMGRRATPCLFIFSGNAQGRNMHASAANAARIFKIAADGRNPVHHFQNIARYHKKRYGL